MAARYNASRVSTEPISTTLDVVSMMATCWNSIKPTLVAIGFSVVCVTADAAWTYTDLYTIGAPVGFGSVSPGLLSTAGLTTITQAGSVVIGFGDGNGRHPLLWNTSSPSGIDLNPTGATASAANATDGMSTVGYVWDNTGIHAALWTGFGSASYVPLPTPVGISSSSVSAFGVSGDEQVGSGTSADGTGYAIIWHGADNTPTTLPPPIGYAHAAAYSTDGVHQVGRAFPAGSNAHAVMWSGSALSMVDLNPSGASDSEALGVGGGQEVGDAALGGGTHAIVWNGSSSFVDLNPSPSETSSALATNGSMQVGYSHYDSYHALVWHGSADSYFDLSTVLPASWQSDIHHVRHSWAMSIVGDDIFGIAVDNTSAYHVIEWSQVSLPGDFNDDGKVDAADYVAWRQQSRTQGDFDTWRTHFGDSVGNSSTVSSTISPMPVPEPSNEALAVVLIALIAIREEFEPRLTGMRQRTRTHRGRGAHPSARWTHSRHRFHRYGQDHHAQLHDQRDQRRTPRENCHD